MSDDDVRTRLHLKVKPSETSDVVRKCWSNSKHVLQGSSEQSKQPDQRHVPT